MKSLPNIITISRIFLAIALLFTSPFKAPFIIVFFICGLSDILDGMLARAMKCESSFGAALDSVADIFFCIISFCVLLPIVEISAFIFVILILVILFRSISIIVGHRKFRDISLRHTLLNKITGAALFISALIYPLAESWLVFILPALLALLASAEEMLINIKSNTLDRDVKSLFKFKF